MTMNCTRCRRLATLWLPYLATAVGAVILLLAGVAWGQQLQPSPLGQGDHHHPFHEDFYRRLEGTRHQLELLQCSRRKAGRRDRRL